MRLDRTALLQVFGLSCLAIAAALGAVEEFAGWLGAGSIDAGALAEIEDLRNRAAAAFAIGKTINAAISVAKEITVSGGLGLAGMAVSPGQVLDPIDDLIEQFATAMLLVAMAAQLVDVLLPIGIAWGLGPVLAAAAFVLAGAILLRQTGLAGAARGLLRFGRVLLALAVLLRFGIPLASLATDLVAAEFLDSRFAAAQEGIGSLAEQADVVAETAREVRLEPHDEGLIGRLVDRMSGGLAELGAALALLRANFDQTFQDVVTLLVVFLLETLLLPLLFLWLGWRLFRGIVASARERRSG